MNILCKKQESQNDSNYLIYAEEILQKIYSGEYWSEVCNILTGHEIFVFTFKFKVRSNGASSTRRHSVMEELCIRIV